MIPELQVYERFGLPLLFWERRGIDPREWKGPHDPGWNDPTRAYDLRRFDPSKHNLGVFTGREIRSSRYLVDADFDKLNPDFLTQFFPWRDFALTRPGKEISHLLYTTATPLKGTREYRGLDGSNIIELRGTDHQTMLPPSLHTPPDVRVALKAASSLPHVEDLDVAEAATLDYAIAMLVAEAFPGGAHHDVRLGLAGCLLKRGVAADRVARLLATVCEWQAQRGVPEMGRYDARDAAKAVESTVARLKAKERVKGGAALKDLHEEFAKRLLKWLPQPVGRLTVDNFYMYAPSHSYLFLPSREFWPASSVNARVAPLPNGKNAKGDDVTIPASVWIDGHRTVEQMTWASGLPLIIQDRLVSDGGWIEHAGCSCVNLYRPPAITPGDPDAAVEWVGLLHAVYPDDAKHIIAWLAHRVQRPGEKINHALVLGGIPGVGKDTILEPVKAAIGSWNFAEINPSHLLGRFNSFVKSVILRISEARDLGEMNRFEFYERMKGYAATPPDVLRCDEKNVREYAVFNVCGVIITTNHEVGGIYLPQDDRRHYVAWSTMTPEDFPAGYWDRIYAWYANGGANHVAAYLARYDLSGFNPKAPPPKTEAFWAIVDSNRSSEDAELSDVIDRLTDADRKPPVVVTLGMLLDGCKDMHDLSTWLADRKNARVIPHRLKSVGYAPYRNAAAKDGLWKMGDRRQVVYARQDTTPRERQAAAEKLREELNEEHEKHEKAKEEHEKHKNANEKPKAKRALEQSELKDLVED